MGEQMAQAATKKGSETRERILDAAQELILECGYSGVSIDDIIKRLGLTKGAFFHHFKNKNELAVALLRRFASQDLAVLNESVERAEKLSADPLQQLLITVGLYEEMFTGLDEPYPGCLLASYTQELHHFNDEAKDIIKDSFITWRRRLALAIKRIAKIYPPKIKVDPKSLADELSVIFEGAFILSKSLNDPDIVLQQLGHYKMYLQLIFNQEK